MSLYCSTPIPNFSADICAAEPSRITAVAIVRDDALVRADQTTLATWNLDIAAGRVHIIKSVRGSKEKGSDVTIDGYGRQATRSVNRNFVSAYSHPDVVGNEDFYEVLNLDSGHHFWFYTPGELIWDTGDPLANFDGDFVIVETLDGIIEWNVGVTWSGTTIPKAFDATAIKSLFE